MVELKTPISDAEIRALKVGDTVSLSGVMITGRDAVHKWLVETFIHPAKTPSEADLAVYQAIQPVLNGGLIYHCGPVVSGLESGQYHFIAAGPTTSMREEPYQADVLRQFNVKGVIGKGGMGNNTLRACQEVPAVYFHAVGGAAALIAQTVKKVMGVYKLEFGAPEAIWVIEVEHLPVVVTMDCHGQSLHDAVREKSKKALERLLV